jgi:hypothetical protein
MFHPSNALSPLSGKAQAKLHTEPQTSFRRSMIAGFSGAAEPKREAPRRERARSKAFSS